MRSLLVKLGNAFESARNSLRTLLVKLGNAFESARHPMTILLVKLGNAFESVKRVQKASGEHPWKDRPFNYTF